MKKKLNFDDVNRLAIVPQSIGPIQFHKKQKSVPSHNRLSPNAIDWFKLVLPKTTSAMFINHLGCITTCTMMCMH